MKVVGKIDREIYKCITPDICSDEVIITDERIAHIKEDHPNDYERFAEFIPQIIESPEYILEDKNPNTGMLLKSQHHNEKKEYFRVAIRIASSNDNPEYKNSVITFWKTHEKEYKRLIRNKKILYKKE